MNCCPYLSKSIGFVLGIVVVGGLLVTMSNQPSAAETKNKDLRHVVMFQFNADASEGDIQKVVDAFRELPSKIPQISGFEYGVNNSPEGLDKGFTHCFLVSFKSEEDRAAYLPHKAHMAFVEVLKPHIKEVMVIDYWADK